MNRPITALACPGCMSSDFDECDNPNFDYHCNLCGVAFLDSEATELDTHIRYCGNVRIETKIFDEYTECELFDKLNDKMYFINLHYKNIIERPNDCEESIISYCQACISFFLDEIDRGEIEDEFDYHFDYSSDLSENHIRNNEFYSPDDKKEMNIHKYL